MDDDHTFLASGDSCPQCTSLDGSNVSAGYKPHENCLCRTKPRKRAQKGCTRSSVSTNFETLPNKVVRASFEVTVTCPDGSEPGASGSVLVDSVVDNPIEALWQAIDELASELCGSCAPVSNPDNVS